MRGWRGEGGGERAVITYAEVLTRARRVILCVVLINGSLLGWLARQGNISFGPPDIRTRAILNDYRNKRILHSRKRSEVVPTLDATHTTLAIRNIILLLKSEHSIYSPPSDSSKWMQVNTKRPSSKLIYLTLAAKEKCHGGRMKPVLQTRVASLLRQPIPKRRFSNWRIGLVDASRVPRLT